MTDAADAPGWRYAEVVVALPAETGRPRRAGAAAPAPDAFTYTIPPRLSGAVAVGCGVRVPFGRRRLVGIVVALANASDVDGVRDIEAVVDDGPWLGADDVALARWMADHYLAPLFACLQPLLPPGVETTVQRRYRRTDAALPAFGADPDLLAIVGAFGRQRVRSEAALRRAVAPRRYAAAVAAAVAAGLVAEVDAAAAARAKAPAFARRLVDDAATVDARLAALRPHAAADALAWLRRPDVVLPTTSELAAATGAGRRAVGVLAAAGLVAVAPAADRGAPDVLVLAAHGARARAAEHALRRTTAHLEALDFLAAAGGAAPTADVTRATAATPAVLRALAAADLIALGDGRAVRPGAIGEAAAGGGGDDGDGGAVGDSAVDDRGNGAALPALTDDQAAALARLVPLLDAAPARRTRAVGGGGGGGGGGGDAGADGAPVALLHGVTGSGKTELYLRAIARVAAAGRQAIVLVPEIALTPQMIDRFEARFPGRVGVWHSGLTPAERRAAWRRARDGAVTVVVGSRSAVFSPLPDLGLVVVDEEHADAYKQDRTPRYHATAVAIRRAGLHGAAVVLGSATPAVTSYWRARRGVWTLLELPRRVVPADPRRAGAAAARDDGAAVGAVAGAAVPSGGPRGETQAETLRAAMGELPPVRIVDMRAELRAGNTSIFSRPLAAALQRTLAAGEQAILFLNRRGSATFVQCRDCGHVQRCPRCDAPLTQHVAGLDGPRRGRATARLVCHACGHVEAPPMLCPRCAGGRIRYVGLGTERLEREAQAAFPGARTLRWDADTTTDRGAHAALLARFSGGQADILVGTQMITKGLDLPLVTLVGVVSADTALHFPDYRAAERAFQLLAQVAGRAGRSSAGGQVVVQTYNPDHPAITHAARHDYAGFYTREIAFRAQHGYPPWRPLWRLLWVTELADAAAEPPARAYADALRAAADRLGLPYTDVLGPAPAFFHRQRGAYRWQILISSPAGHALLAAAPPPPGWRIDVDALDVL